MTTINRRHVSRNRPSGNAPARQLAPRWLLAAALAAALGATALAAPAPARAQDDLVRVLVDVADVIFRSGTPYYRGDYDHRLVVVRDRHGRPSYYRYLPRHIDNRYGNRRVKCNKHGKCKVSYYDPRYDRDRYDRVRYYDRDRDWRDRDRDWDDDDDDRRWRHARHWRDHDDD